MKVLLTGTNGFIGKNVYIKLKSEFDLIPISTTKSSINAITVSNNFENIEEVLSEYEFDSIIHLAAVIPKSFSEANFTDVFLPNALMMDRILKFAVNKKVRTFIYLSGYGSMEDYNNFKMKDYYTLSKVHGEHICSIMESKGIRAISLRIPSPYGLYSNPNNVINQFVYRALKNETVHVYGSGKREQNFVYINDIVDAIKHFIINPINSGTYDIVSKENTNMEMLARYIVTITNSNSEIIIGEKPDMQEGFKPKYNNIPTFEKTGFQCKYTIEDGLRDYINRIKEQI